MRASRVWVDLANSPHVPLLGPVISSLEGDGHDVVITVRDHAQTLELAQRSLRRFHVSGRQSPPGRVAKARSIARRAEALRRFASKWKPDVALSHGSYAQLLAARIVGIPGVTMMDYEYQPANHLSFRLAERVIVPTAFPEPALRRCGAAPRRVTRYPGFKEELYLGGFTPDHAVLDELRLDPTRVIVVMRPPPEGALYHRMVNERFEQVLDLATGQKGVQLVLLPRSDSQAARYGRHARVRIPERVIDGSSLVALADLVVGAGGTMNRESAVLGTPTYTVFAGKLAAVDAELIRLGRMLDLRDPGVVPRFEKKGAGAAGPRPRTGPITDTILTALAAAAG